MAKKPPARKRKKAAGTRRKARKRRPTVKRARKRSASRPRAKAKRPRTSGRPKAKPKPKLKPKPKRPAAKRAISRTRKTATRSRFRGRAGLVEPEMFASGLGPESGGQSGDIEGLPSQAIADSESVEELVEEGQAFEAGIVDAVENAPDADQGEVRTREVPEDDVPEEYLDDDRPSRR